MTTPRKRTTHKADGTFKKRKFGKYNAKGERCDGHWFASQAELVRYQQLKELQEQGLIAELTLQPSYRMTINSRPICTYRADFRYAAQVNGHWVTVIEDVKGMITPEYALKRNLFAAIYGEEITEIPSSKVQHMAGKTGLEKI